MQKNCSVAPVLKAGARKRSVYLPKGDFWEDMESRELYDGGRWIEADAPLSVIPVFHRKTFK